MSAEYLTFDRSGVATNIVVLYIHRSSIIKFIVSTIAVAVRATIGTFLNTNDLNAASFL